MFSMIPEIVYICNTVRAKWPHIEWIIVFINLIFSSTFIIAILVITLVSRDMRHMAALCLAWLFWLTVSAMLLSLKLLLGAYHIIRIILDLIGFGLLKFIFNALYSIKCIKLKNDDPQVKLLAAMSEAKTFESWYKAAVELDILTGAAIWRKSPRSHLYEWKILIEQTEKLKNSRKHKDIHTIVFLLRMCASRDFCGVSNSALFEEAHSGTKLAITAFIDEYATSLQWLCNQVQEKLMHRQSDKTLRHTSYGEICVDENANRKYVNSATQTSYCSNMSHSKYYPQYSFGNKHLLKTYIRPNKWDYDNANVLIDLPELLQTENFRNSIEHSTDHSNVDVLLKLFANLRLSLGRTALCLSGGGSLAMYHIGVVKTLLQQNCLPRIISGTSGGSIVAGVLGIHNDQTLRNEILCPEVVSKYRRRWFPPMIQQVRSFFLKGQMLDENEFQKTCRKYYGDMTFKEAFQKTGRLISIVVTPANQTSAVALILNCINSPDVLIWSAVTASCSLPGLLPPHTLMAKCPSGKIVPYNCSGLKWMDGSLSQDIPLRELASLFNVKQCVVSQVNPHHAPFVDSYGCGSRLTRCSENWLILDIKYRYAKLAKLNIIPRIFGQDISGFWMAQEYQGNVTITPKALMIDWFRMINQPTVDDMKDFITRGESRTFPHCVRIMHIMKIEQTLQQCWTQLMTALDAANLCSIEYPINQLEKINSLSSTISQDKLLQELSTIALDD